MIKANHHTHSSFCDGKAPLRSFVEEAIKQNFRILGFSGHAPVNIPNNFAIKTDELLDYCNEVNLLKKEYKDTIDIYLGLEADYIPTITTDFDVFRQTCNLDYIIGSVHLVVTNGAKKFWFIDGPDYNVYDEGLTTIFNGDIKSGVQAYFSQINEMIITQKPEVVGHLDKVKMHNNERYFSLSERWYEQQMEQSLEIIKANGSIVEVNTRGLYKKRCDDLFPGSRWLPVMHEMGIPVMINSDAHHPGDLLLEYDFALEQVKKAGYTEQYYFDGNGFSPSEI